MAVTIKKKALTITSLVTRLFGAEEVAGADFLHKAQELEMKGYTLSTSPTKFSIVASGNAKIMYSVPLKIDTVTLAMKKKIGHTVKQIIKEKVVDLIEKSYQKFMDDVNPNMNYQTVKPSMSEIHKQTMAKYGSNGNKVAAIKLYRSLTGCSLKDAKDQVETWIDEDPGVPADATVTGEPTIVGKGVPVEDIKLQQQTVYPVELDLKAAPVALKNATKLNQPVTGTSGGSIYHVVAIGQNCVVAVRIKGNNEIAIRAETIGAGEGLQKAKSGLKFAGLDLKPAGHWSLHLEPEDFAMVKRSIGSTIMAMSIPFFGVNTDLHTLQGVGK